MTVCSRLHTSWVSVDRNSRSRPVSAVTSAYDSAAAESACSRPASMRRSTALVSVWAAAGSTPLPSGPCTVTSQFGPMNWSSSM